MFGHIFSLLTLIAIGKYLQGRDKALPEENKIIRIVLIVLSSVFSMLYFINGVLSMKRDFSLISLFMIEYGLLFVYLTYKLSISSKGSAYQSTYRILKKRINSEVEYDENKTIDQLIRDTLICLEDDDFENASLIIGKVGPEYAINQNIEFLKTMINQALSQKESDYSQTLCY